MKNEHHSAIVLFFVVAVSISVLAREPEDKARIWETFAVHAYSNLNAAVNGELTPVFRALGDVGELQPYFDQDRNPKKYEAVCLMANERNLRFRGIIDPLADDQDERVRVAVGRIKNEYPPFWKD